MVVGGNSNGTQMKPHCGGPRCQAGEGAVFLGEQELEGLGLVRWGRCRFVFQRENLASGGVVVVVTTMEVRAPVGQEEWV